jgi:hypothetical protein
MPTTIAGFPFWELRFKEAGEPADSTAVANFIKEVKAQNLTDLFIFSHGWNNTPAAADILYRGFFGEMQKLLDNPNILKRRAATIGTAGVFWPSIKWPDEEAVDSVGGAASLSGDGAGEDLFVELKKVFTTPQQQQTLDELSALLDEQQRNEAALKQFKVKLRELVSESSIDESSPDSLEQQAILYDDDNWEDIFDSLANTEPMEESAGGAAAGFGDRFGCLWRGARGALRTATYWQMKERAGVVGRRGLGPLVGQLHRDNHDLKVHLIGHSFGARLVSYALAGLPDPPPGRKSPVKSLFLLQGAFSHFTFAAQLPFDQNRKGELGGMSSRVDGPLLATHTLRDLAVGHSYPIASFLGRQDASRISDIDEYVRSRWGAMGYRGAQGADAEEVQLAAAGFAYACKPGKWINLDGNQVIVKGETLSGAHSDIIYPHTAWVALSAAGIG